MVRFLHTRNWYRRDDVRVSPTSTTKAMTATIASMVTLLLTWDTWERKKTGEHWNTEEDGGGVCKIWKERMGCEERERTEYPVHIKD